MKDNKSREEMLAELFHETYERLAPGLGYETREDTKKFNPESSNGKLMIAVAKVVQDEYIEQLIKEEVDKERFAAYKRGFEQGQFDAKMNGLTSSERTKE